MSQDSYDTPVQNSLPELLSRYLRQRMEANLHGLSVPKGPGEVLPFEAAPVQPVEPRLAWDEATLAARLLVPGCDPRGWKAPPEWASLVATHEPVLAVPCCLGNFPQMMRDIQGLVQTRDLVALRPVSSRPVTVTSLAEKAHHALVKRNYGPFFAIAGALRLARQFETTDRLLRDHSAACPAEWQSLAANERAALDWHRGQADEAAASWREQPDSIPVLFNRGMSALFSNQPTEATPWLTQAVAQIPEENAWHHLGRLYLMLAALRS
jgi:hypothetical protein